MERAILLFVILFSLSPLANASTPNAETDSIILYKDMFFRGTRLFPKDINGDTVRAIESRVFKVLLSNDTLVAVTDNPAVFPDELKKLSRGQIRMRFMKKGHSLTFDDDVPSTVSIHAQKDTLEYIRDIPVPGYPYTIWNSVIESFELIKINRNIRDLVRALNLEPYFNLDIHTIFLIHPIEISNSWAKEVGIKLNERKMEAEFVEYRQYDGSIVKVALIQQQ